MTILLDTAVFLWMIFGDKEKISRKALHALENSGNELFISAASAWEISVKYSLGKLELAKAPHQWLPEVISKMGLQHLPIQHRHAFELVTLPHYHKDPFDRLLITQSKVEGMPLMSPDRIFRRYKIEVIW